MALTEEQIRRYARHILLPEVGGVGQERLLAAEARVAGENAELVELATLYLRAAGVTCDAHSGPGLELVLEGGPGVSLQAIEGGVRVAASACSACRGRPSGPLPAEAGATAASLAASELLRLALALGPTERAWRVGPTSLEGAAPGRCPEHG